jgi:hypothetical protein
MFLQRETAQRETAEGPKSISRAGFQKSEGGESTYECDARDFGGAQKNGVNWEEGGGMRHLRKLAVQSPSTTAFCKAQRLFSLHSIFLFFK